MTRAGALVRWARAPRGEISIDNEARQITLVLPGMTGFRHDKTGLVPFLQGDFQAEPVPFPDACWPLPIAISDMTFRQLQDELARQERSLAEALPRAASKGELLDPPKADARGPGFGDDHAGAGLSQSAGGVFLCLLWLSP